MPDIWLLLLLCALGTYALRALGVLLSGRISVHGDLFTWVTCVTYAMIAGLVMRIIVMPAGLLATSLLAHRLLACALGLAAYYLARRNLLVAVGVGAVALVALENAHFVDGHPSAGSPQRGRIQYLRGESGDFRKGDIDDQGVASSSVAIRLEGRVGSPQELRD